MSMFSRLYKKRRQRQKSGRSLEEPKELYYDLIDNSHNLSSLYKDCPDVIFHSFFLHEHVKAQLIYIEGLVHTEEIDDHVLIPLTKHEYDKKIPIMDWMDEHLYVSKKKRVTTFNECVHLLSIGHCILLVDGEKQGFSFGLTKWEMRSVEEPTAESVVRGPREGFTETLAVNISMLRRKIRSPDLKIKQFNVGSYTRTSVIVAYIEGLTDKTLIEEVGKRIEGIEIDGILETSYVEELIQDNPLSPFPQMLVTERPDVCISGLLEGRATVLVDGTPFALVLPATLFSLLQSGEDYYQHFMIATAIRWLRIFLFMVSLLLPSLYVAILTFHQEMLPTPLLLSIAASREMVPFPALMEAFLMEVTFEALREAGLRLPKQIGAAVSIVGALVIGETAVQAGLVSTSMVMVVAFTGIASFSIPRYNVAITLRMLRFPMILLAGTLGLVGIMIGIIFILVHLCSMRTFGVPYLSPAAPANKQELKDVFVRAPLWKLDTRPHFTGDFNKHRQGAHQKPVRQSGNEE
ncbi:spore germination protein [Alteribacillus sp. HJP-4]|uniref:spore germination protein n=1 Tax=Alteribacillus sp. HJP-4 TaxID=2775394 RepID=UPI0035CCE5C3